MSVVWNKYTGIEFVDRGRCPMMDGGLDCYGLIRWIKMNEFGQILPRFDAYDSVDDKKLIHAKYDEYEKTFGEKWSKIEKPERYCIAMFNYAGHPMHVGMIIDDEFMIHTEKGRNSCIESYRGMRWGQHNLVGYWRYNG